MINGILLSTRFNLATMLRFIICAEFEWRLRWYLEKLEPAPSNDTLIDLKFVFDGARMTSRGNKVQEVGTFDLLFTGQSLSTIRSPTNSHQWAIIFSEETRENLRRELKDGLK